MWDTSSAPLQPQRSLLGYGNAINYRFYLKLSSPFLQEETERLLNEHNEFKTTANETRERVKLLIQLSESVVEKGHAHATTIKQLVASIDKAYKNFSSRMDKYRLAYLRRRSRKKREHAKCNLR